MKGDIRHEEKVFLGLTVLLAISGICIFKNAGVVQSKDLTLEQTEEILREYSNGNPNNLTPEQIKEVLKEYAEANPGSWSKEEINERFREFVDSVYGPDTDYSIVSYGQSGVGYINHETGDVVECVTDTGDEE